MLPTAQQLTPSTTVHLLAATAHLHGNCVAFGTLVQLVLEGVPFVPDEVQDFCLLSGWSS